MQISPRNVDPLTIRQFRISSGPDHAAVLETIRRALEWRGYGTRQAGPGAVTFTSRGWIGLRNQRDAFDLLFLRGTVRVGPSRIGGTAVHVELRMDTPFAAGLFLLCAGAVVVVSMPWYLRLFVLLLYLVLFARIRRNTAGTLLEWIGEAAEAYQALPRQIT